MCRKHLEIDDIKKFTRRKVVVISEYQNILLDIEHYKSALAR